MQARVGEWSALSSTRPRTGSVILTTLVCLFGQNQDGMGKDQYIVWGGAAVVVSPRLLRALRPFACPSFLSIQVNLSRPHT